MDAETFRWLMGAAFLAIVSLLTIIWKSITFELGKVRNSMEIIENAIMLDLRGLDTRITWLEAHAGNGAPRNRRLSDRGETTLG